MPKTIIQAARTPLRDLALPPVAGALASCRPIFLPASIAAPSRSGGVALICNARTL